MSGALLGILVSLFLLLQISAANENLFTQQSEIQSLSSSTEMLNSNARFRTQFAAIPRNMDVVAVVLDDSGNIGLRVTWQANQPVGTASIAALSYTLFIIPLNQTEEDEEEEDNYCGSISYHQDLEADITEWIVRYDIHNEDSQMKIQPECSYKVILWANPRERNISSELHYIYTVPKRLPQVYITSLEKVDLLSYRVTWRAEMLSQTAELTDAYILVIVGPIYMRTFNGRASLLPVESETRVVWSDSHDEYEATFNITQDQTDYMVVIKVKDKYGCEGPAANRSFTVSSIENTNKEHNHALVLAIAVPSIALLLVLALGVTVLATIHRGHLCRLWFRRKARLNNTLQPVKSWRPVYRTANSERNNVRYTSTPHSSAEERNILYVEQEIQEALERGETDGYEVNYNRIHFGKQIGRGAFGRVYLARIDSVNGAPINHIIAVKQLRHRATPDEFDDFLTEISTFKRVGRHPNIVSLVGCCTLTQPYCMLMEWVPCGDLLRYLRSLRAQLNKQRAQLSIAPARPRRYTADDNPYLDVLSEFTPSLHCDECAFATRSETRTRANFAESEESVTSSSVTPSNVNEAISASFNSSMVEPGSDPTRRTLYPCKFSYSTVETPVPVAVDLDVRELHSFALQIASGMVHLERLQITHRDLAARNVLIDLNRTLKISDFGLSRRGVYVNTKRRMVPLRWLSTEAMRDHLYSSRSDVWAFGVVLWEIGTLGGFPYHTVADVDLLNYLQQGKRLEKPQNCTEELYALMMKCWQQEAENRPTFADLCSLLETSLGHQQIYVDFTKLISAAFDELPPAQQIT